MHRACVDSQGESGSEWASVFTPTKFDSPIELVHTRLNQLPNARVSVVYKGTHGYMLVLYVPCALQNTTTNTIAQILHCCLRMNVDGSSD
jgi:hypothetical protein